MSCNVALNVDCSSEHRLPVEHKFATYIEITGTHFPSEGDQCTVSCLPQLPVLNRIKENHTKQLDTKHWSAQVALIQTVL